ncbi:hypothetical protein [Bacillus sp. FSL K6-0268]|uniref:hypothetical protein n=1 Tax=Bacillus sp. FSL K6-0268 TaxID=2921449 RepID=UPI0030FAA3A8
MDIITVESTTNVCIFGLGIAVLAYVVYKGGTFIEQKFDESDRLEREALVMGIESRVLPEHLEKALELEEERRECIQNLHLLYKQMNQANKKRNKTLYLELHNAYQKQSIRDLEISKQLSAMYFKKQKSDREAERTEVFRVADRLEKVGGRKEVVERIRKNA